MQGAEESLIGLVSSKVSPHARHRYSYLGMRLMLLQAFAHNLMVRRLW